MTTLLLTLLALLVAGVLVSALFTVYIGRKVTALLPPQGRFVDVPGARLHVHDGGAGPAIVMVHGLAGQLAHYTYGVAGDLERDHRVVAVDRPGSGHSTRALDTGADLRTQAAALAALIATLGLERPLVVGHSLGGAVALTLALEHPDSVGGIALIAPLTHMQERVPPVFKGLMIGSPALRRLVAWTLAIPASIRNSRAALEQVFGPDPVPRDFALRGGGLLGLRPQAFLSASLDLQALPGCLPALQARWRELRVPVHVLYGRDDRILAWREQGQALVDQVPGARLDLVEGGHMLPITHPLACIDVIRRAAAAAQAARAGTPSAIMS